MANATFVKQAQKDIYTSGKYVKYESKKGKRIGQELTKLDRTVPKDNTDTVFIAKGESYYWWAFKNGRKHFSKTHPKPSQLTQSNYLSQLYLIQERVDEISALDAGDIESFIEELKSDLESLKEETEGSLENMPESLQSSPTGELLQERIDSIDSAISELDGIEYDYDEPDNDEIKQEIIEEEGDENYEPSEDEIEGLRAEKLQEWIDEKINEIQSVSFE